MKTGYFANTKRYTKKHVVYDNDEPVCGVRISKDMSFQWCASGIYTDYIECERCIKWNNQRLEMQQR